MTTNALESPEKTAADTYCFVLDILGFSDAEKSMLYSTFRLTGRRHFSYVEANAPGQRADIYLVNADSAEGMAQLRERSPNQHAPAVLVGRATEDHVWPVIPKPVQWIRLFEQLDQQMDLALRARARREVAGTNERSQGNPRRRATDKALPPLLPAQPALPPTESVLVVDDSATVRAFMRTRLAPFRFDIDYAETGEMAVDMAQAKNYTCIFLDVLMPGMDGYQVCKRIKSSAATKDTAVVMLTSKSGAFDKFRGSWAGCDAYLGKPVNEDELLATIARFLPSARRIAQSMLAKS